MPSQSVVVNTDGWKTMLLPDCIERVKVPSKIPKKQYLEEGTYPVISQEATQISGYWNDLEDVFSVDRPLIIFGDHTCNLKFVDFDFVVGADGVKILKPKEFLDGKFFFYQLLSFNLQSTGYARHFRKLKEYTITIPSLEEQQLIVSILDEAFENISNSSKRVEQKLIDATELFSSLVEEKYTDKEGKWNQKTISELCKIGDGNHSSKYPKKSEMIETGIPFIRGTNLVNGRISDDDIRYITEEKHSTLKKGHLLTGDVLFTNRGEIGKVAIVDERFDNANLNSQLAWFRCGKEITPEFLFYFLQKGEMKRHFSQSKTGAALQQFTIKMIKSVSISYPSIEEQKEIVESCQLMQKRVEEITQIYLKESDSIVELKQSILREAFNGTLRIAEGLAGQS